MNKNLLFGTLLLALFLVSGCTSQNTGTGDDMPGTVEDDGDDTFYQPSFTVRAAGCDKERFYISLDLDKAHSGVAELRVYDNVDTSKVVSTKIEQANLAASANLFSMEHGQQLTGKMDYSFCLGGTCERDFCVVDECLKYTDLLLCNSKAECTYDELCINFRCSDMKTMESCGEYPYRCEWFTNPQDTSNPYCRLMACPLHNDKEGCDAGYNCQWLGSTCKTFNCRDLNNPDICGQDSRCVWEDSEYGSGNCDTK
jgi:hypothetical protein